MSFGHRYMVMAIAPAQGTGDGDILIARLPNDIAFPRVYSLIRQSQPAQPVIDMRIDSGLIEHQIGRKIIQYGWQMPG